MKLRSCSAWPKKSTPAPNGSVTRTSVGSSPPQVRAAKGGALPREHKSKDNQSFSYKICQSRGPYPETLSSKFLAVSQIPPLGHEPLNYDTAFWISSPTITECGLWTLVDPQDHSRSSVKTTFIVITRDYWLFPQVNICTDGAEAMMQKQWWAQLLALSRELRQRHQSVLADVAFLISLDSQVWKKARFT